MSLSPKIRIERLQKALENSEAVVALTLMPGWVIILDAIGAMRDISERQFVADKITAEEHRANIKANEKLLSLVSRFEAELPKLLVEIDQMDKHESRRTTGVGAAWRGLRRKVR